MLDSSIIETNPFPVFVVNEQGGIIYKSACARSKFPHTEQFADLVDARSQEMYKQMMINTSHPYELQLIGQNGLRTCMTYKQLLDNNRFALYCIDQTEERNMYTNQLETMQQTFEQANDEMVKRNRELKLALRNLEQMVVTRDELANVGKLAASIAHEIRNPLTSIRGFLQLLQPYIITTGKEMYAEVILSELDRVNDMITEFLNSSKSKEVTKKILSLHSVIRHVILLCQSHALLYNCSILYRETDLDAYVYGDEKQMKQLLLNIIKNAMEAVQDCEHIGNREVVISLRKTDEQCIITVSDNGKGMDEKTKQSLFTPFFTTKENGNGIGLPVCQKIIELHGGAWEVESEVDRGTAFSIILPAVHG